MDKLGDQLGAVIRPVIALVFTVVACWGFLIGLLNSDQWLGLGTVVITFYFAAKTAENASRRAPNRATDVNIEGNVQNVNRDRDEGAR